MTTDETPPDAKALRDLADDLKDEALEADPATPQESGVAEGLGRAVGKAEGRARQIEQDN